MNAPPVLRPLRAIFQRRLQIVPSRPTRAPYYLRVSHLRAQLRYTSSTPPDQTPNPEDSAEAASKADEGTPSESEVQNADGQASQTHTRDESGIDQNVDATGHDASSTTTTTEASAPRLDGVFIKSAFQQLKTVDEEIQRSIAEAVERQLEAGAEAVDEELAAAAPVEAEEVEPLAEHAPEIAQAVDETLAADAPAEVEEAEPLAENAPEIAEAVDEEMAADAPAEAEEVQTFAEHTREIAEAVVDETAAPQDAETFAEQQSISDPSTTVPDNLLATPATETVVESVASEAVGPEPPRTQEPSTQSAAPEKAGTGSVAAKKAPANSGGSLLDAFANASPEEMAALMAHFQQLQAAKTAGAAAAPAPVAPAPAPAPAAPAAPVPAAPVDEAPEQQESISESAASATVIPQSPSSEAVASMTQPIEPSTEELEKRPVTDASVSPQEVEPKPTASESGPPVDSILKDIAPEANEAMYEGSKDGLLEPEPEDIQTSQFERPAAEELNELLTLTPDIEADIAALVQKRRDSASSQANGGTTGEAPSSLQSMNGESAEPASKSPEGESTATTSKEGSEATSEEDELGEPSRMPRNVQAFYLQPLRRVAKYGVPSCDLQLRSYSIRPLESFCDFALRAAYYLGLPAHGPVPLPKIIERWTVPKSNFIHKKSQENFERITRRRLIQIKDGHPETVQIWLAFLRKHQQAAVGMKANLWEFSSINVAKQLDEAFKEAEPMINDKARFLEQSKQFSTAEKADEFLQSEKYRLFGGQFAHKEERIGS